jgi:hypothetical protein
MNAEQSLGHAVAALGAEQAVGKASCVFDDGAHEHSLDPLVKALLTNVVRRLRGSWLTGPALLWGDIHPVRKVVTGEFDKRIATTLVQGFAQFSEFLAGFEMLVLELEQRGVVTEQRILGLEKRIVEGGCLFCDEFEVSDAKQCFSDVFGRADGAGDDGKV